MALFSTWYSGGGPMPWEGHGPGQLRRSEVPLPLHFAFPVFPYLFLPEATLPCEGHEGTSAGLFLTPPLSSQLLLGTGTQLAEGRWVPGAALSLCWAVLVLCVCCESGEQGSVGLRRGTESLPCLSLSWG